MINRGTLNRHLIIIGGATATGKSQIALLLAKKLNCAIVSTDSRQVYSELSIGVARPTVSDLTEIRHYNIGNISIHNEYSVGRFEEESLGHIEREFKRSRFVICVGGTGLYIDAIRHGLDDFPKVPKEVRERYQSILVEKGLIFLQSLLKSKDPTYYDQIDQNNGARIVRALSVIDVSNRPFSDYLGKPKPTRPFNIIPIVIELPRVALYDRIDARVDKMIKDGLIEEARALWPYKQLPCLRTVGYQELFEHFDQAIDKERAIELIKQKTRNYAKRQITWFKSHGPWHYFSADDKEAILRFVDSSIYQP